MSDESNLAAINGSVEGRPHQERPPFKEGNFAALKIGARSPRVYGKVAEGIADNLLEELPQLAQYPEELAALAHTEAIAALLRIELAAHGLKKNGEVRLALLDRYFRAETAAAKRRDAIGISPIGEAVLARERASAMSLASGVDLEALAARGREALAARVDIVTPVLEQTRSEYLAEREAAAAERERTQNPALDSEAVTDNSTNSEED